MGEGEITKWKRVLVTQKKSTFRQSSRAAFHFLLLFLFYLFFNHIEESLMFYNCGKVKIGRRTCVITGQVFIKTTK